MDTPKGKTLVFSRTVPKRLSISPFFPLEFTPADPSWDEKVDQHLLRLNRRIADLEKKVKNLNQTSSQDTKSSIGQDGADGKVSPSEYLKLSNKEQTNSGTPNMRCSNDIGECNYFSPPWQKRMEISRPN